MYQTERQHKENIHPVASVCNKHFEDSSLHVFKVNLPIPFYLKLNILQKIYNVFYILIHLNMFLNILLKHMV